MAAAAVGDSNVSSVVCFLASFIVFVSYLSIMDYPLPPSMAWDFFYSHRSSEWLTALSSSPLHQLTPFCRPVRNRTHNACSRVSKLHAHKSVLMLARSFPRVAFFSSCLSIRGEYNKSKSVGMSGIVIVNRLSCFEAF